MPIQSPELAERLAIVASMRERVVSGGCCPTIALSPLDIEFFLPATTIRATYHPDAIPRHQTLLVLPLEIRNPSPMALETRLSHEWYGGEWPRTDLYIYGLTGSRACPVFRVGDLGTISLSRIAAGAALSVDLRMNWPGTIAPQGGGFMPAGYAATYSFRFALVFGRQGFPRHHCAVSPLVSVRVEEGESETFI